MQCSVNFVRAFAGILFSKVNLDDFDIVLDGALREFEGILKRNQIIIGSKGHGPMRSDAVLLQLVALAIYFVPLIETGKAERYLCCLPFLCCRQIILVVLFPSWLRQYS